MQRGGGLHWDLEHSLCHGPGHHHHRRAARRSHLLARVRHPAHDRLGTSQPVQVRLFLAGIHQLARERSALQVRQQMTGRRLVRELMNTQVGQIRMKTFTMRAWTGIVLLVVGVAVMGGDSQFAGVTMTDLGRLRDGHHQRMELQARKDSRRVLLVLQVLRGQPQVRSQVVPRGKIKAEQEREVRSLHGEVAARGGGAVHGMRTPEVAARGVLVMTAGDRIHLGVAEVAGRVAVRDCSY